MYAMSFRARIRRWLGIDDLVLALSDVPSVEMYKAMELAQKERHRVIMEALARIEGRMVSSHVSQPRNFTPPTLDWDTVQAIAAQSLIDNPEPQHKEN
jgi:hypothetical protein